MSDMAGLERRLEEIERVLARTGLHQCPHYLPANLRLVIADEDGDGDRDPYISATWAPNTLSDGATGTIDWETDFGLPEKPKLVSLLVGVRDSASAGSSCKIHLRAKSTTTSPTLVGDAERAVNDDIRWTPGCVPVADDGTTYYGVIASGVNTMDVWIRVVTWIR